MKKGIPIDHTIIAKERSTGQVGLQPQASVVIVTYNTSRRILRKNLQALAQQTITDFETIIVDNSDKKDLESLFCAYPLHYLKLRENFGLSFARNVGIHFAKGEVVIFLDDDAIPVRNFVEQHIQAFDRHEIVGLRGKALPRTRTIYNRLTTQYDLGDEIFPYYINLEGNSSFKKEILLEMEGFQENLKDAGGHEGAELSFRIVQHFHDRNQLIYYPSALIRHDFCGSFGKYVRKLRRHAHHKKILQEVHPELFAFLDTYLPSGTDSVDRGPSPFIAIRLWLIRKGASLFLRLDRIRRRRV